MKILLTLLLFLTSFAKADVVKPALVEVSLFADYRVEVVINLSLEAAMTGIGTQYKNTTQAPNSQAYDRLRALEPEQLAQRFAAFESEFAQGFALLLDGQDVDLTLSEQSIDIIGYKKRPRKTVLTYSAQFKQWPKNLQWHYVKNLGDSALRYQVYEADQYNWSDWQWLREGKPSALIDIDKPPTQSLSARLLQFVSIGFDHVIPLGWDHILFIIGMALSSLVLRNLLWLTASFTLAHTITLGLASAEIISLSARIVEPLIAFSIAYVALENLWPRFSIKRKSLLVFVFGLVHGLGFATMLREFEMAQTHFITTLIGFNIGVELAQVLIVLLVVSTLILVQKTKLNPQIWVVVPASIVIALIGLVWGVERLIA